MEGEGFMVGNNYLKCKYVINPNYVLHIYVLSSVKHQIWNQIKTRILS